MTLCISGGRVLLPDLSISEADVLVDPAEGDVLDVGPNLAGETELDATGGLVIPGLINAHTHAPMTLFRGYDDDKPVGAWLREDIWPVEAELTAPDIRAGAELGIVEMIRSGTTTFADMYFGVSETAAAVRESGIRACSATVPSRSGRTVLRSSRTSNGASRSQTSSTVRPGDASSPPRCRTRCRR